MKRNLSPLSKIQWEYFETVAHRHEYLGHRFFATSLHTDTCIQIVLTPGQEKKGRGHVFGVYCISRLTLFSNYMSMGYTIPTTKKKYTEAFNKVVDILKPV